ncbi:hypothetical protein ACFVWG_10740 [Kribbella sp. NPDC058245]|uniref:hypothetical protein n=1 Tax=Kribbella sp. NPDC058245 TaxID=3346399 RepID=UPI0036E2CC2B
MASPLSRVNVRADLWETLWSFAHRVLAINLLLALAGTPLMLALSLVATPWSYPVFFGLLALPLAPAAAAAFGYLALEDPRPPLSSLFRLAVSRARRSLLIAVIAAALIGVLAADIKVLIASYPGAVPLLVVLLSLVAVGALNALVLVGAPPLTSEDSPTTAARLSDVVGIWGVVRLAVYSGVRGWGLSLLSLGVLFAALVIVSQAPLAGLVTVPGCALWVVHTNSQAQLARIMRRIG